MNGAQHDGWYCDGTVECLIIGLMHEATIGTHSPCQEKTMPFLFFLWSFCLIEQFRYPISYVLDIRAHTCSFNSWIVNFVYVAHRDDDGGETDSNEWCLFFTSTGQRVSCVRVDAVNHRISCG